MRPTWLLEANVTGLPSEELQAEIRRQGMQVHVVKYFPASARPRDILGAEHLRLDAFVLFIGTITLMQHIRASRKWVPGGWCAFDKLACSVYYAYFGEFLLNRHYAFVPNAEVLRQEEWFLKMYGDNGRVFVRPDAADKSFTGKVVDSDSLRDVVGSMAYNPARLVLVTQPQQIGREWRLVVANGRVITGSQYCEHGNSNVVQGCPAEVRSFAEHVLSQVNWRPDPIFMMDVCETAGGLRVLELNGFSCASLYLADLEVIVAAATELAMSTW